MVPDDNPFSWLRFDGIAYPVTALGPGKRLALWTTGCGKRCPGCISPEMQDKNSGKILPLDMLIRHILRIPEPLDGITVSGGEPFDQAESLSLFLSRLRQFKPHWNVLLYTGYTLEDLQSGTTGQGELLKWIDVLIDGEYQREMPSRHPLAGSGNQRVLCLTPRGRALQAQMDALPFNTANLGADKGETYMLIGILDNKAREEALEALFPVIKPPPPDISASPNPE